MNISGFAKYWINDWNSHDLERIEELKCARLSDRSTIYAFAE
jgi:hypothetical protein